MVAPAECAASHMTGRNVRISYGHGIHPLASVNERFGLNSAIHTCVMGGAQREIRGLRHSLGDSIGKAYKRCKHVERRFRAA